MYDFFLVFFWGVCILIALLGWGWLVLRLLQANIKIDFGWQGSLGLCLSVIAGGILNLAHLISKQTIMVYLSVGWLLFAFFVILHGKILFNYLVSCRERIQNKKFLIFIIVGIIVIVLVRYASSVAFFNFNPIDDQHAYMVFPVKMLQTGSLGDDPFSERRLVSALGGEYFLNTFILAAAGLKNLHLMGGGIGLLIFLFSLIGFLKDRKLPLNLSLAVLFLAVIIPLPSRTVTSFYTAAALFLAIPRLLFDNGEKFNRKRASVTVLSLLAVGLCALKSNFIFPCAALFAFFFFLRFKAATDKLSVIKEFIASGFLVGLLLLPWMIATKQSSGTLLYPFLGKGYIGSVYGTFLSHYLEFNFYSLFRIISEFIFGICLFIPFFVLGIYWWMSSKSAIKSTVMVIFLSAFIGMLAMIYGNGGYSLYYYTFSFLLPTILVGLILILEKGDLPFFAGTSAKAVSLGVLIIVFIVGTYVQADTGVFQQVKDNLNIDGGLKLGLLNGDLVPEMELKQYSALQKAIPAGEPILARLDRNFVFNFNRNPVYIIDAPGGASLPPGMPYGQGSEKMANYFLGKGIKYVAYSYGNEANYTRASCSSMLRPHVNPLLRTEAEHAFDFQDNLMVLAKTRKKIYDDGKNFVLDFSQKF